MESYENLSNVFFAFEHSIEKKYHEKYQIKYFDQFNELEGMNKLVIKTLKVS